MSFVLFVVKRAAWIVESGGYVEWFEAAARVLVD